MRKISTGEPSTLGTYLKIAKFFGPEAQKFIQTKMDGLPDGENEEVVAEESQMLQLLATFIKPEEVDLKNDELMSYLERLGA